MSGGESATLPGAGFAPGRYPIDSYGRGGFRFGGLSHRGSILMLPSGVAAWPVADAADIRAEHLEAVLGATPPVEFLILGTGAELRPLPEALRRPFREAGISVDAMTTGAAARTYNVLVAENRRVAAALVAVD